MKQQRIFTAAICLLVFAGGLPAFGQESAGYYLEIGQTSEMGFKPFASAEEAGRIKVFVGSNRIPVETTKSETGYFGRILVFPGDQKNLAVRLVKAEKAAWDAGQAEAARKQKEAEEKQHQQAEAETVSVCVVDDWVCDVPAFLFINKKTSQRIPVSILPVDGKKQYCVKQMPIGEYHVEIQYNGKVWAKTEAEVTKELSAAYKNEWYHCVVKASDGEY